MRECLGCETYAKYTHTRVSSCAHFMFASASVRPPGPPSSFLRLFENATPRLPASTLSARACSLYGPASRDSRGPSRSAVVLGGIRDDTSPMSPRRSGMYPNVRRLPRIAEPLIYRACAPINGESHCQIVIWTAPLQGENDEIIFARFHWPRLASKSLAARGSLLAIFLYLDYRF